MILKTKGTFVMKLNELGSIFIVLTILLAMGVAITARYMNHGQESEVEKEAEQFINFEFQELEK